MEVPTHILDQQKEDVAIETSNPSMEGKSIPMFQVEGARIFTPSYKQHKGPNRSTNNNIQTFQ
jgi:hypothetical protein